MKNRAFVGKSILVGIPNHFQLPERFRENLEYLGFKVFILQNEMSVSLPLQDTLIHGYKKFILKDRTHKPLVKNKLREARHLLFLEKIGKVDYALFIRPDLYSYSVIEKAKTLANKTVAYQWDGLDRFPLAKNYIDLFDKFYVFDKNDLAKNPKLLFSTNFYFDDIIDDFPINEKSVFFVGSLMEDRIGKLENFASFLESKGLIPDFYLNSHKVKSDINGKYTIINNPFPFKESILKMQQAEYLLDLHNPIHNGLSFRSYESIGYDKKLITNNVLVKDFDFYNPNNIFVIENDNFSGFEDFVASSYQHLPSEIKEKYSFSRWIENILG